MTPDNYFSQQISIQLCYKPNQHIVRKVLAKLPGIPVYSGYSFNSATAVREFFLQLSGAKVEKITVSGSVSLFDDRGKHFNNDLTDCKFEFYLVTEDGYDHPDAWLLLDMDDLLFYLNRYRNNQAIADHDFPKLHSCELGNSRFDFILRGREFRNQYFPAYSGPVFDTYYGDEFRELYAIASNALAFLYRSRDRVMEELELSANFNYRSSLNLYPRFNNGIAEVAGTLYAAWERVAFLFHEFFPLSPNPSMAPSFKRYMNDKLKEAASDTRLQNAHLDWFKSSLNGSHQLLETLRHPTVHYNSRRSPSGTRAVELMKASMNEQTVGETKLKWDEELTFLRQELAALDEGLEQAIGLLEEWGAAQLIPKPADPRQGHIAFSFIILAYRDYIAARFLINNDLVLQGLTLASTAIEKYLKVLLIANGRTKKEVQVHLNRLPELKHQLAACYYDVTKHMDERFLEILGQMYSIRYYDDIKVPVTIGFFKGQFLGELDSIVHYFETKVITGLKDAKGDEIKTPYRRDADSKDEKLTLNNYLFNGLTKKQHMEKPDHGFAVAIRPDSLALGELRVSSAPISNSYDGRMAGIDIKLA